MSTDERNFRSTYYEKVGFKSVEEKKSLEILLKDKRRDRTKLKQFCLRFTLPGVYRGLVWKIVLTVLPVNVDSYDFCMEQQQEACRDTIETLHVMGLIDSGAPRHHLMYAIWLIQQERWHEIYTIKLTDGFPLLAKALDRFFEDDTELFGVLKKLYAFIQGFKPEVPRLIDTLWCLLEKEDDELQKHLKQQFGALLGNTSTSVKFICGVVLLGYGLSFSDEAIRLLSVTPGYLMPSSFWLWTAFTFCFLELHFWEVLTDIITVGLCGKLIEPLWGQMEMMTFFAVVNFGVAVLSAVFYFFVYMCTFNTDVLFSVHIHGLAGYIAGVSVAVKQIMPDLILIKTPLGKLSNRNVPLTVFFASLILWLVGLLEGTYPTMFLSGLLISWIYLRFYQRHSNGSRGDMADYFTFASFFPNVIQPPIAVISNTVYGGLVKIGCCRKVVRRFDIANPTGITISVPGADQHDMERRRQIALKALSERLSKSSQGDKRPLLSKTSKGGRPFLPGEETPHQGTSSSQPPNTHASTSSAIEATSSPISLSISSPPT